MGTDARLSGRQKKAEERCSVGNLDADAPGGRKAGRSVRCRWAFLGLPLTAALLTAGCSRDKANNAGRVVVYASLDREFSEPILKDYSAKSGVNIDAKYDIESTKTVGLTESIAAEAAAGRARCDLFWNNEIVNTLRLRRRGLLAPFRPAAAAGYPAAFRAADGSWYGFAARARIILVNTRLVPEAARPRSLNDLTDPKWKGKVGMAKPMFGTTATHAACLFAAWGDEKAKAYFRALKHNGVNVLSGNKQVATAVGSGQLALGLTDTDDAVGEVEAGQPVAIVYPDREPGSLGTLFIPNTLCLVRGAPHADAAEALADFLLSPEVESRLARGPSAQIPLNPAVTDTPRAGVETPKTVHAMEADWESAVDQWEKAMAFLLAEFGG
jgi:iron(III) transport system substrate-binding protein